MAAGQFTGIIIVNYFYDGIVNLFYFICTQCSYFGFRMNAAHPKNIIHKWDGDIKSPSAGCTRVNDRYIPSAVQPRLKPLACKINRGSDIQWESRNLFLAGIYSEAA